MKAPPPPPWQVRIAGSPNGYAAIEPAVVAKLRADGVVWSEGGEWLINPADVYVLDTHPEHAICDFCNETPVVWRARCADFELAPARAGLRAHESAGDWAACDACGRLVAAGDRRALLVRAVAALSARHSIPSALLASEIAAMHDKFWRYLARIVRFVQ